MTTETDVFRGPHKTLRPHDRVIPGHHIKPTRPASQCRSGRTVDMCSPARDTCHLTTCEPVPKWQEV